MRRWPRAISALVLCSVLAGAWNPQGAIGQNLPNLGGTEREELSPAMERRLGEQIMRDIRRDRDYLDDPVVLEYLNDFGAGLVAARPDVRGETNFDYFFFAVRDPMINAFAMPGGFIGVHSALILASQTESELASVLAHEIGHVAQRHIARMIGAQRQDALIPLAGMILGAIAARSRPDLGMAAMAGSEGLAIQRQLNFSRDAEREADRIGVQILQEGGFDTSGMVAFFGRLQSASRAYNDSVPAYLRSHPLTTERIADIQGRIAGKRYRQRADSVEYQLVRARVRLLQDNTPQGMREAANVFESQLAQKSRVQTLAAKYGLALIALKSGDHAKAQGLLQEARAALQSQGSAQTSKALDSLAIELRLASGATAEALKEAEAAKAHFPLSRGMALQYADALIAAGKHDDAVRYLRDQSQMYREEASLHERLAKVYAAQGKQALQHMSLAEAYVLNGSLPSALDQLSIARRAPDASFYDQAMIDAREREWKARWREEMKETQPQRR